MGDKKAGVVWHAQGSGKGISMCLLYAEAASTTNYAESYIIDCD